MLGLNASRQIYCFYEDMATVIVKEIPVMSTNDMIGALGGSLGLFLGFSFCGTIFDAIDLISIINSKVKKVRDMNNFLFH